MQEHHGAACKLDTAVAADLLDGMLLLGPVGLRTATERWCDIAEREARELHFATAQFSWFGNGKEPRFYGWWMQSPKLLSR